MSFNSLKDVIGHVENALYLMKGKGTDQSDDMAYGNSYPQHHNQAPIPSQHPPSPPQNYIQPPHSPPMGWSQCWDHGSQRHYYIEQATGRSQWEPPAHQFHQPLPRPTSSQTFSGEQMRQDPRPHSNSNASQRTDSPLPRAMSIPPGYSFDTRTGQLVNTMLPPSGHHSAPVKYW